MTSDATLAVEHLRALKDTNAWWSSYRQALDGQLSTTALDVLDVDCGYIVDRCLVPAGQTERWPESRVRKGLVMGAVQSGKTASMIGVAAKALDSGVDLVLVLSGTRTALWQQTFQRLADQLDFQGNSGALASRRLWMPNPDAGADPLANLDLASTYRLNAARANRAVATRTPMIVVAMKNVDHLLALARVFRRSLVPAIDRAARPFHMLVIDDEADDGSVLDARAEAKNAGAAKQIPRYIVDLWDSRPHAGATASQHLYATYMAYTATPQANFLQEGFNPLAPQEFVVALRTPGPVGQVEPREPSYAEPAGVRSWYTGGDFFYSRLSAAPLCVSTDDFKDEGGSEEEAEAAALDAALKAYLVAAAVRLWRGDPDALGPASASGVVFSSKTAAKRRTAKVSSMLIHPSASKTKHFDLAATVLGWAAGTDVDDGKNRYAHGERYLDIGGLCRSLVEHEATWKDWLPRYRATATALARETHALYARHVPGEEDWETVRRILVEEIFPAVRVAVINSDEMADDRPRFEPVPCDDGWLAAPDTLTIFVSGSVMSRGLTLEGLLTTYFSRRTENPLADTQMQMQRWFGYRGEHVDLCRVFLTAEQLDLFRSYHENDEALRRQVLALMDAREEPPNVQVLQGLSYAATGKIAGLRSIPLSPTPHPFFPRSAAASDDSTFAHHLASLFQSDGYQELGDGRPRGLLLGRELGLEETASLLDSLRFEGYAPGDGTWEANRWMLAEAQLRTIPGAKVSRLYRPPVTGQGDSVAAACPYSLAAYLRFWHACLGLRAPGLYPTDDPRTPWSLLDLQDRRPPTFRVAIRLGSGRPIHDGPLGQIGPALTPMQRSVDADGILTSQWGSHNPDAEQATGDEYFDMIELGEARPSAHEGSRPWRPNGTPGLLLLHLVERPDGPGLVLGASIPLGGPNQFAAYVPEMET